MGEKGRQFLARRAPFYLAGAALLVVLVVPGILEKDLYDIIPDTLEEDERAILEYVLEYTGPNDTGMDMAEAVSSKIEAEWPGSNPYDHHSTRVMVAVMGTSIDAYRVTLDFESQGERLYYDWDVDTAAGIIRGNNDITKDAVDMVDFYD